MMAVSYVAVFHFEDGGYWCEFPDLQGCFSQGDTVREVLANAKEALEGYIECELEEKGKVPPAREITEFKVEGKDFLSYVTCDILQKAKSVKKTLTIPAWLNDQSERLGVNFSRTLQEALLKKLDIA